jgi:ribose 5-phosphate isomerase A|tara:strand:- start:194 stop:991 length:798 start_codon:yes stop_codon:yes gene_type:complete
MTSEQDKQKKFVGNSAAWMIKLEDGDFVGIGSGTTMKYFVMELGKRIESDGLKNITGVPTSVETAGWCAAAGIKTISIEKGLKKKIRVAVDGADEVDDDFNLIKGGGGAHVREKLVDYHADRFIVIVDKKKDVGVLGTTFKLPVEVEKDKVDKVMKFLLGRAGAKKDGTELRMKKSDKKKIYETDNENYIIDAKYDGVEHPENLEILIESCKGVVRDGVGIFTSDHVSDVWICKKWGDIIKKENTGSIYYKKLAAEKKKEEKKKG